jgi:hypothetical protein
VEVDWRSADTLSRHWRAPRVDLGTESVNATLTVALPADRWVFAVDGPRLGPAVLFWGVAGLVVVTALVLGRARLAPLSTLQWLLLGIGLTQTSVAGAVLVVVWLLALAARRRLSAASPALGFNLAQVGLVLLSFAALAVLFDAVRHGLLGAPDMQIAGNGSSAQALHWFQDRLPGRSAEVSIWSVSIWWYRALMLAWALWLAAALLGWLRVGWGNFTAGGLWRRGGGLWRRRQRDAVAEPGGG